MSMSASQVYAYVTDVISRVASLEGLNWASLPGKPTTLSAFVNDINATIAPVWANITGRPTKLSDFTNDVLVTNTTPDITQTGTAYLSSRIKCLYGMVLRFGVNNGSVMELQPGAGVFDNTGWTSCIMTRLDTTANADWTPDAVTPTESVSNLVLWAARTLSFGWTDKNRTALADCRFQGSGAVDASPPARVYTSAQLTSTGLHLSHTLRQTYVVRRARVTVAHIYRVFSNGLYYPAAGAFGTISTSTFTSPTGLTFQASACFTVTWDADLVNPTVSITIGNCEIAPLIPGDGGFGFLGSSTQFTVGSGAIAATTDAGMSVNIMTYPLMGCTYAFGPTTGVAAPSGIVPWVVSRGPTSAMIAVIGMQTGDGVYAVLDVVVQGFRS